MKYLVSIILLILVSCESTVERIPRVKEKSIKKYDGKDKAIFEYECDRYEENRNQLIIEKNSCKLSNMKVFNPDDVLIKVLKWHTLDYPNDPEFVEIKKVNEFGLVIEESTKQTGKYPFETKNIYSYNKDGFKTEEVTYLNKNLTRREEKIYDEYNCPIKEIFYDKNNKITRKKRFDRIIPGELNMNYFTG